MPAELAEGTGIAANVAALCVTQFADVCSVYLHGSGPLPAAIAARETSRFAALRSVARDDTYVDRTRGAGIEILVEEPLVAGGRAVGALVVGFRAGRKLTPAIRAALRRYASILATAAEQAERLDLHFHVSKRLQQALLPARLAEVEGIRFDAAYVPATAGTDVGGDWYDTFEIGNGLIGISIGDVVGHGIEAAVAMSEIRGAIRATAAATQSPAEVLRMADELMVAQTKGLATAIVGFYDPATGVLRYASAGHPAPVLLLQSGRAGTLPAGGVILGLGSGNSSGDITITIPPGATLFLYTDGLLEYDRDPIAGEVRLLATIERLHGSDHYADALHAALFGNGVQNADDCATLAIHRLRNGRASERYTYSAIAQCAALAREALREFSGTFAQGREHGFDVLTAVGEAIANAIEHGANGDRALFEIDAGIRDGEIVVEVRSRGHWRAFAPSIDRGRGLHIMRTCAKRLEISSEQDETRVKLIFG